MSAEPEKADPDAFLAGLAGGGIQRLTGVPCSSMTGLINAALDSRELAYINAPNEGEALAYAAGAWMGGRPSAVLCQNSGLSNLSNALTSLVAPYRIPVLLIVGWRGRPGAADEPQHRLVGGLTRPFLKACGLEVHVADAGNAADLADACARTVARDGRSQAILVPTKLFQERPLADRGADVSPARRCKVVRSAGSSPPTRRQALQALLDLLPEDALIIAPTGLASRELCDLKDSPAHFYMMGSMGHAAALGLGVASTTSRPVVVLDGDGSILMRLGALAFVGAEAPGNFRHVVLDNGVHESTGGQTSLSNTVDLCAAAAACGYWSAAEAGSTDLLAEAMAHGRAIPGPGFIRLMTAPERSRIPPRIRLSAEVIATRFSHELYPNANAVIDKRALGAAE
jgi:phosphonopyruvate decarboxylase